MEPNEDSSLSPRRPERPIGAQELPARGLGPRRTPPARAAGPQVTTGGAGAPRTSGHISSSPLPGPHLSRLSGGKLGLDPGTGRKRQPNCSSDHRLRKGGSAFRNFSHFSLSVSVFWCLQNLQRFAYFDSSGVRAVLGSTRR